MISGPPLNPVAAPAGPAVPWRHAGKLLTALCLAGAACILFRYWCCLPLRIDEIRLALNLVHRDYAGLVYTLDHEQGAPLGFLWLAKFAVARLGQSEYAFRLVPLLAGLAALPMVILAARRALGTVGLPLAAVMICFSPYHMVRSTDLKQYSLETLVAAVLLWAAVPLVQTQARSRDRLWLGLLGLAAILLSHGALFTLAGMGLLLGVRALLQRQWRVGVELAGMGLLWAAVVAVLYWVNLRHLVGAPYMQHFWDVNFMPAPTSPEKVLWFGRAWLEYLKSAGLGLSPVLAVFWVAGLWRLWRTQRWLLALLLAPAAAALAASAARQYPFSDRLLVFLGPTVIVIAAAGGQAVLEMFGQARRIRWGLVLAIAMVLGALPLSGLLDPWQGGRFDFRILPQVGREFEPGDEILVGEHLGYPYNQYRQGTNLPWRPAPWIMPRQVGDAHAQALGQALAGHDRAWVLIGHNIWQLNAPVVYPLASALGSLEQMGTILRRIDGANLTAVLVRPRPAPNPIVAATQASKR